MWIMAWVVIKTSVARPISLRASIRVQASVESIEATTAVFGIGAVFEVDDSGVHGTSRDRAFEQQEGGFIRPSASGYDLTATIVDRLLEAETSFG